jgi:hypothetical protein
MGNESIKKDSVLQQKDSTSFDGPGLAVPPPAFSLESSAVSQLKEDEGAEPLTINPGELTTKGEGSDAQTKYVHWPETNASGVTLGKGYDIGSRSEDQVVQELMAAGMGEAQARKISKGAGKTGQEAGTWVAQNKTDVGEISSAVQYSLLATMLESYKAEAKSMATNTEATKDNSGYYVNARGREINDKVAEGTYRMTEEQWNNLHPAMIELLTDLKYQGGYYAYDRIAQINKVLIENDGDHLAQFKAVVVLFEAAEGESLSYMDKYGKKIGEGTGNKETFYGQDADGLEGASTRRNRVRLGYLKEIISALEAGKKVEMSGAASSSAATTTESATNSTNDSKSTENTGSPIGNTSSGAELKQEVAAPRNVPAGRLIAGSVGAGAENHPADVEAVIGKMKALGIISATEAKDKSVGALEKYIVRYQKMIFANFSDGTIEPGKTTESKLIAGVTTKPEAPKPASNPGSNPAGSKTVPKATPSNSGKTTESKPEQPALNYTQIAKNVNAAMAGAGTDEATIMANLRMLKQDATHIAEFKKAYLKLYGTTVEADLRGDLSDTWLFGNELTDALELLKPNGSGVAAKAGANAGTKLAKGDDITNWLAKTSKGTSAADKNKEFATLILEAEKLGLVTFNEEGKGSKEFSSGFGGCHDTFIKIRDLKPIGNGKIYGKGQAYFYPDKTEMPILKSIHSTIHGMVESWDAGGRKGQATKVMLGSFMVWNSNGANSGRLRDSNHGGSAKAIDLNISDGKGGSVDFGKPEAIDFAINVLKNMPKGTYEIGLPKQGDFIDGSKVSAMHSSKANDGNWTYTKIKSKALRDQIQSMIDSGYVLKVISDYNNHFHYAIGSGGAGYAKK